MAGGAVATGSLLGLSPREGSKCPRIADKVSDVAGGRARGDPFADIVGSRVVIWVTQGMGRLLENLSLSRTTMDNAE